MRQPGRPRVDVAPGTETGDDLDSPGFIGAAVGACVHYQMTISYPMLNASGWWAWSIVSDTDGSISSGPETMDGLITVTSESLPSACFAISSQRPSS